MDIGRLTGQKGVCRTCGQRGHYWAAECPKRGKVGQGGKGDDGKGQGKKGKAVKGKADGGKGKGKGGKLQVRQVFGGHCKHCWEWGHMEKDCFTLTKSKGKGGKGQSAGSLDVIEASGPEHTSVGGFGFCDGRGIASLRELQSGTCSQSSAVSVQGVPARNFNHPGFRGRTKWHASQTNAVWVVRQVSTFSTVGFLQQ